MNKKYLVYITTLVVAVLGLLFLFGEDERSFATESKRVVKGVFSENIDGVDHEKIIEYGPSGVSSIEEMIAKLGLGIYPEDKVEAFPDPDLGIGSKIIITRATEFSVIDAGKTNTYRTWENTVEEAIKGKIDPLGVDDDVNYSLSDKMENGMKIKITRVAITEVKEYEQVDYDVVYQDDPTMYRGETVVDQYGSYGERELTYEVTRENGVEVSKVLLGSEITTESVDKIVRRGTKVLVLDQGIASFMSQGIYGPSGAAHKTLPMGSQVLVRASNGNTVLVTIVDRGPYVDGRVIDLSYEAFMKLAGNVSQGVISVTLEKP